MRTAPDNVAFEALIINSSDEIRYLADNKVATVCRYLEN